MAEIKINEWANKDNDPRSPTTGALVVPSEHVFTGVVHRDEHFTEKPEELTNDMYIVMDGILYKRVAGVWKDMTPVIRGTPGQPGVPGQNGIDGTTIHQVNGTPNFNLGSNGDYAFDPITFNLHGPKRNGLWISSVNLKGDKGVGVDDFAGDPMAYYILAKS